MKKIQQCFLNNMNMEKVKTKFCTVCGKELKTRLIKERGFDRNTGELLTEVNYMCPNYQAKEGWFGKNDNGHDNFTDALNFKYTYNVFWI